MRQEIPDSFEIVIKKENDTFRATCSIFPGIFGEGQDEEKAIESLADGLAHKMGTLVKTVITEVFKGDFQALRAKGSAGVRTAPPKRFVLPPVGWLLRGKHIDFAKRRPVLRGTLMLLDMRREQFCQPMPCEEQLFASIMNSGVFAAPLPAECVTPFGILLGVPLIYN
ncbi:hypothetical protein NO2_0589 [Candidatus Termititenax persephonae]|uniref:Uncharacterized protein n=1 Tax=Candidatus Termititenax persephonae TaxID=2218525 RepID=A0A388TFY6_9BACT|nr:hypothetical protein NO2_0589 [Candidatus Termititenax persephonae]